MPTAAHRATERRNRRQTDRVATRPTTFEPRVLVLIDYDNLAILDRRRGLAYAIDRILNALGSQRVASVQRVDCRLYGGWFDGASLSSLAQQIISDITGHFPSVVRVTDVAGSHALLVHVELASSLAFDPRNQITHTYRRRSIQRNLRCIGTPFPGCVDVANCSLSSIEPFMRLRTCTNARCGVTPHDVLYRGEQKLVDSMMLMDLIHFTQQGRSRVAVVSGDDDLWPGMRFALLQGAPLVHVVPRQAGGPNNNYSYLQTSGYVRLPV